jgi:two-component system NtrC family sensor kinase
MRNKTLLTPDMNTFRKQEVDIKMKKRSMVRQQIERNGLILIALVMVLIYWVLDSMASDQVLTRVLIVCFVIIYGIFTQTLINSRKAALEEKDRTQKQLIQAEKLAALGIVAAGIAHEVKNPLAIIIQGVEYLKSAVESDATLLDVTERIKRSAFRADNIIKGLLSFTRQTPIQAENAEITPIIEETLSFVEYQIKSKHIRIVRQYAPDLPNVTVDSNQIKQVFVNLLLNSFEAMQNGGTITITTEATRDEKDKRYLQVSIADTGCGIPENKLEKVFDPFYTTKDTPGNAGLGLSVTKGIIDKHHGKIRIESEADKGTRVIIGLPADNAQ